MQSQHKATIECIAGRNAAEGFACQQCMPTEPQIPSHRHCSVQQGCQPLNVCTIKCTSTKSDNAIEAAIYIVMCSKICEESPAHAQMSAVCAGTDIAIEAANYVLMRSDLEDVLVAMDLSRKTFQRIRLNYVWALGYNVVMIPVAAGVLYPTLRMQIPPWIAGTLGLVGGCRASRRTLAYGWALVGACMLRSVGPGLYSLFALCWFELC